MPHPEKRRTPRIQPYLAPCRVIVGEARVPGYVTDLSLRGARVRSEDEPPTADTSVILEMRLGGGIAHSRLSARVKWMRATDEGYTFGVVFEALAEEAEEALRTVLDEFKKRAAALEPKGEGRGPATGGT